MQHKSIIPRMLLALTLAVLLAFAVVPALAASYHYDVIMGGVLTVNYSGDCVTLMGDAALVYEGQLTL